MSNDQFSRYGPVTYLLDLPVRAIQALPKLLPHRISLDVVGWLARRVLAPIFRTNRRIMENLAHAWPELSKSEIRNICAAANDNAARLMIESLNTKGFIRHAAKAPMTGDGVAPLMSALKADRPVVLVSGHFGNFHVVRVLLMQQGYDSAAIYRPLTNGYTNARFQKSLSDIATTNVPRGMKGTKTLVSRLRSGKAIAILNDQAAFEGVNLTFFGKPARTMLSAAELALKFNALLVPCYGIRRANGVDFDVEVEAPVPHTTAEEMTQALNDSLEAVIRRYPGQWFWLHRRWKNFD